MAVREHNKARLRRTWMPAVLIAIIGVMGASVTGMMLERASAARGAGNRPVAHSTTVGVPSATVAPVSLAGVQFPYDEGASGYLVGEYEG